jgi:hypothetical protein
MADLSTLLPDADVVWEGDNVIELPNLVSGPLAELLAAAGAQGHPRELAGEATMRHEFQVAASEWPSSHRHPRRASAMFAASLVAGTILATTGLAAATGLPLPTTHLVDQAITQINQDLASPPASVARPGVIPFRHHPVVHGGTTVHALRHVAVTSTSACLSGTTAAGGSAGSCLPARSAVPTASGSATASAGTVTAAMRATHTSKTTATKSGTHKTTKGGTHKTGGGGSSRGGNHGKGGTHKTGGGGSSRGGNHGKGGTHKTGGGGSSRGGNRGTATA